MGFETAPEDWDASAQTEFLLSDLQAIDGYLLKQAVNSIKGDFSLEPKGSVEIFKTKKVLEHAIFIFDSGQNDDLSHLFSFASICHRHHWPTEWLAKKAWDSLHLGQRQKILKLLQKNGYEVAEHC